jgi:hypothetical protein
MKKITIHLLFTLCFLTNLSAQHAIQSEWSYTSGTDKPGSTLALSWYNADAALAGDVIRLSYTNTKEEVYYDKQIQMFQLDIAKRWNSTVKNKVNAFFEAGLSGMMTNTNLMDREPDITVFICDCLIFPPIQTNIEYYGIEEEDNGANFYYDVNDKTYEIQFLPGVNVNFGLEVLLVKSFYMGIHTGGHLYYHLGQKHQKNSLLD